MRHILPHPVLALALAALWLALTGISPGQVALAVVVALGATAMLARLDVETPRVRSWSTVLALSLIVAWDILLSNLAVAGLILRGDRRTGRRPGIVAIPLTLTARPGLAWLAVIITATPGTAWVAYDPDGGELLLHVFDLDDPAAWRRTIIDRYEARLKRIYE